MAEKKTTAKSASKKAPKKPVAKPAVKAAKTASGKTTAKKAAPAKKEAPPAKKAAPVKKAAAKKAVSAKKATAKAPVAPKSPKVVSKESSPKSGTARSAVKPAVAKPAKEEPKSPAAPAKAATVSKKSPATKQRPTSSLVNVPPPPAPVKPPFVPPKPPAALEPVATGANGSHSPSFIQKQRQRLLDLRDELVDAMSGMTRDTIRNAPEGSEASGSGMHQGDAGSDAYDRDFALSVLAKEQDALYEIEQALRRIDKGAYGICEMSSRKIPTARLEAIPFARLTVECQAQWEKEYGNRRFRPSNEVGFSGGKHVDDEDSETVSLDEDDD